MSASIPEQTCLTCTNSRLLGDIKLSVEIVTAGGVMTQEADPACYRTCRALPPAAMPNVISGAIRVGDTWAFHHLGGCHVDDKQGGPAYNPMFFQRIHQYVSSLVGKLIRS